MTTDTDILARSVAITDRRRRTIERIQQREEAVERIRSHHDRTLGHSWTTRVGYCAEPDGIGQAVGRVVSFLPAPKVRIADRPVIGIRPQVVGPERPDDPEQDHRRRRAEEDDHGPRPGLGQRSGNLGGQGTSRADQPEDFL